MLRAMRRTALRLRPVVLAVATALLVGGCGGRGHDGVSGVRTAAGTAATSPGAALRADLTAALVDAVHLEGLSAQTTLAAPRTARALAAATAVDDDARTLAGLVAQGYGARTGRRFLALWRTQNGAFSFSVRALGRSDRRDEARGRVAVTRTRAQIADLLARAGRRPARTATGAPPIARAIRRTLGRQQRAVLAAIAATGARGDASEPLSAAGRAAARLAGELTDDARPGRVGGPPEGAAGSVRAALTAGLTQRAHLTLRLVDARLGGPASSSAARGAQAALDATSAQVAGVVGALAGSAVADELRGQLRHDAAAFVAYAVAKRTRSATGARAALATLAADRTATAAILATTGDAFTPRDVDRRLAPLQDAIAAAIRGDAVSAVRAPALRQAASDQAALLATSLAAGFARQDPGAFAP